MACTIRDIAREAGVSVSTVSLVLRGKECRIADETRQRIQRVAKQMNYIPNQVAVSLVTKKTHTIGLIYSDMLNPFYAELAVGVERNAQSSGYSLLICNCDEQVQRCIDNITLLESRLVDGFILQPPETTNASPQQLRALQEKLKNCQTPYVILDRAIHDVYHDYVAADHQLGGYLAAEHLYKLGHLSLIHIFRKMNLICGYSCCNYIFHCIHPPLNSVSGKIHPKIPPLHLQGILLLRS